MGQQHTYAARVTWEGNRGEGTSTYTGYGRDYRIAIAGKTDLRGSADAAFLGSGELHNPEEHFLMAISACHMLFFLALCAKRGAQVVSYEDEAIGTMAVDEGGSGAFTQITLRPATILDHDADAGLIRELHEEAHRACFIANSCSVPIACVPTIRLA